VLAALEPHTEADPVALLLQFLTAVGSAAGRCAHDEVEDTRHYGNLYTLLVGQTSRARKGTSWERIRRLLGDVDPDWVTGAIASGLTSGEGLVARIGDDKAEGTDKRLLVYEPEFGRVLKVIEREGNTLSALIREAWERDTLQVLNKQSPLRATGGHVSIIAHITAEELTRLLGETEIANGLANRFLIACVRRSRLLPRGGQPERERMAPLVAELHAVLSQARRTGRLTWTEAALQHWAGVYRELTADRPGLAGALVSRAEAQVVRLAVVYALLDQTQAIDVPHLQAALAVWSYCQWSVLYLFGDRTGDAIADAILRELRAAGGSLSRWELSNRLSRNVTAAELNRALEWLSAIGLVVVEQVPPRYGKGRPTQLVRLVLGVYEENEENRLCGEKVLDNQGV
jgi:hypothetical protein